MSFKDSSFTFSSSHSSEYPTFFFVQIWPNGLPRVQSELQHSSSIPRLFVKLFLCPSAFFTSLSDHSSVRQRSSSLRQIVPLFVSVLRLFLASVRSLIAEDQIVHPVAKDQIVHQHSSPTKSPIQHQIVFFGDAFFFRFCFSSSPTKIKFRRLVLLFRTWVL